MKSSLGGALLIARTLVTTGFRGDAHINSPPITERCAICGELLASAPTVPVRGGGAIHIACADRVAWAAWRQRWWAALGELALLMLADALLWRLGSATAYVAIGAVGGLIAHIVRHRRFWYYIRRDLTRLRPQCSR